MPSSSPPTLHQGEHGYSGRGNRSPEACIDAIAKGLTTEGKLGGEQGDMKERLKTSGGAATSRGSSTEESESSTEEEGALECVDEINQGMDEPATTEERGDLVKEYC